MAKLTLEELKKLRENKKKELNKRDNSSKEVYVTIGMATCGIAAGSREVLQAFLSEIDKHTLDTVSIKQTGCMGLCSVEPTVEISMPDMPDIIYGKVTPAVVQEIVEKHILNKTLVNEHIFDKPAPDNVVK